MNTRISIVNFTPNLLLLLSITVTAQVAEPQGELQLYHRATQIGTVARREFKDGKGRIVKDIYYSGGGDSIEGPYREDLLREQSIRTYAYDEHDCRISSEIYEPGMKLSRTQEVRCFDATATPRETIIRNPLGIKQMEIRHNANGGTQTELFFDSNGSKIIAIGGELPTDVDLAYGWGEEASGFVCGIAANRQEGRQEELRVLVTIKNIGHDPDRLVMISPVLVELKNQAGRVFEWKPASKRQDSGTSSEGCPTYLGQGAPSPGNAQLQTGLELGEQYDRLTPGKYSLTVTYCVAGVPERLVSNSILLEVQDL